VNMELWQQILLSEEAVRARAREERTTAPAKTQISGVRAPDVKPFTYTFDRTNYTPITQTIKLLEVEDKSGEMQEFVIKSASSAFSIELNIDGQKTRFYKSWSELSTMAEDINGIVAVHRNGEYLVNLAGMFFSRSIYLAVIADGLTFTKVYVRVKYDG